MTPEPARVSDTNAPSVTLCSDIQISIVEITVTELSHRVSHSVGRCDGDGQNGFSNGLCAKLSLLPETSSQQGSAIRHVS